MNKDIKNILKNVQTVAIIGCSAHEYRTSHHIAKYLQEHDIQIVPVNPNYEEILGNRCYPKMTDVPGDIQIDIIDIFRDSQHTAEMMQDILIWSKESEQKPVVWTQLAVSSDEAKSLAQDNDFSYVENKCVMVQHDQVT